MLMLAWVNCAIRRIYTGRPSGANTSWFFPRVTLYGGMQAAENYGSAALGVVKILALWAQFLSM